MSVNTKGNSTIRVDGVMTGIETAVRDELRRRLIARGGPSEFRDAEVFERVHDVLARAADRRDLDVLLLPELLADEEAWKPAVELRISSHRPIVGPIIVFMKRRVVLPLVRWLFEYTEDNFRRQDYVNRVVMACLEELAIDNARLRGELHALGPRDQGPAASAETPSGAAPSGLPGAAAAPGTPSGGR